MATEITVPRLGWSMEEGTFVAWLKKDGDRIKPGDPLFSLESDKATEEIPALDEGMLRLTVDSPKPGEVVRVGQVLAYLTAEGEALPTPIPNAIRPGQAAEINQRVVETSRMKLAAGEKKTISPRARRLALKEQIDWTTLHGSGRHGRIRERDVRMAAQAKPAGSLISHSSLRRITASRMVAGSTQAAPVTLFKKIDASALVALRENLKRVARPDVPVPTFTDILLHWAAKALVKHPMLRAQWRDEGLFIPERIDIALAVDTEAGLLAPVVRNVDHLELTSLALQTRRLIERARSGNATVEEMQGAIFTISNLGNLGIDAFTPILHLPQCAVLGIGRIRRELVLVDDKIVPRDMMTLSLTFDHRSVDGAPAARFLNEFENLDPTP